MFNKKETLYWALEILGNAFYLLQDDSKLQIYEKVAKKTFKIYRSIVVILLITKNYDKMGITEVHLFNFLYKV